MFRKILTAATVAAVLCGCSEEQPPAPPPGGGSSGGKPIVTIETSLGTFRAELWTDKAPVTVANFLSYVDRKFYDGTIFHRVIPGFMAQGGGFDANMREKPTGPPIRNEARSDVPNTRGTLAMARTDEVDSATSQFFINFVDGKPHMNHTDDTPDGFGYCVFGKVIGDGMTVVDKFARVPTNDTVPAQPIIIKSIRRAN